MAHPSVSAQQPTGRRGQCLLLLLAASLATATHSFVPFGGAKPQQRCHQQQQQQQLSTLLHRTRGGGSSGGVSSFLKPLPSAATAVPAMDAAGSSSSSSVLEQRQQQEVAAAAAARKAGRVGGALSLLLGKTRGGAAAAAAAGGAGKGELWEKVRVWVFIGLWYVFNVAFNIYNKKVLIALPLPWTVSVAQLGLGALYALLLWAVKLRTVPSIAKPEMKTLSVLGLLHAVSHITAITSLGAGAVSFTHIVKSAEPFFSAVFAGLFFRQFFNPLVYLALVPVVSGVAYASLKELTFTWLSFWCAMASNVVCAARGVVVKGMMGGKPTQSKDLTSSNMYSVLTILAALMLLPFGAAIEGPKLLEAWKAAAAHPSLPGGGAELARYLIYSGLTFFLYNEVAFMALESLHPISHAVANTIKRVVIIVVSVLVFRNPMSTQSIIGSATAVLGVLLYSLAKHYCK